MEVARKSSEGGEGLAKRPKGPGRRHAQWIVGPIGPVMASVYWRPFGRSGTLKWVHRRGRVLVSGLDIQREWEEMMAQRPKTEELPNLNQLCAGYGSWEKLCPTLAEWLCDGAYDDGSTKGEVTLTLRRNVTTIAGMLKIEDGGLCLRASGDTPDDVFVALELLLSAPKTPWEVDTYPLGRQKGKRK